MRILVADDNAVNRLLAVRMLEKRGYSVVAAANGAEAIAEHEREPADLILMDVEMPELDGIAATARIRQAEKAGSRRVPIIALTAHDTPADRERCASAGMDCFLSKPFKPEQLWGAIVEATA
jgi:two-component system sensor histidine kinase/response regulator